MNQTLDGILLDTEISMKGLSSEMEQIKNKIGSRTGISASLSAILRNCNTELKKIQKLNQLLGKTLEKELFRKLWDIDLKVHLLERYIAAIARERDSDRRLEQLLTDTIRKHRISWINDLIVNLGDEYASLTIGPTPIIYCLERNSFSFIGMSAVYHELGHTLFTNSRYVQGELSKLIGGHFRNLLKSQTTIVKHKGDSFKELVDFGRKYWDRKRLNEIFSDVFATVLCGLPYYFYSIEQAFTESHEVSINPMDEHPPWPIRIHTSYLAIRKTTTEKKQLDMVENSWKEFDKKYQLDYPTKIICNDMLLDEISTKSVELTRESISAGRNRNADNSESDSGERLDKILLEGLLIRTNQPSKYSKWQENKFARILDPEH